MLYLLAPALEERSREMIEDYLRLSGLGWENRDVDGERGTMTKDKSAQYVHRSKGAVIAITLIALVFLASACREGHGSKGVPAAKAPPPITFFDRLYDVAAVSKNIWVVGYYGKIVHSADGGVTWTIQQAGTTKALLGICMVNDRVGGIVGASGTILHTTDGGTTWKKQESGITDQQLLKVPFLIETEGFVVGASALSFIRPMEDRHGSVSPPLAKMPC